MSKTEYMECLKKKLSRLPREDYERAIEYFEEYFAEAGPEQEAQAMEDLGTPQFASEEIIKEIAINNAKEPVKDVKKGLNAVWVGILAVFAVPIGLPLVFALVLTIVCLVASVFLVFVSFVLAGGAMIICVPLCVAGAMVIMPSVFPAAITCIGMALFFAGAGMAVIYGSILQCRRFLTWVVRVFGRMLNKGGKKNER